MKKMRDDDGRIHVWTVPTPPGMDVPTAAELEAAADLGDWSLFEPDGTPARKAPSIEQLRARMPFEWQGQPRHSDAEYEAALNATAKQDGIPDPTLMYPIRHGLCCDGPGYCLADPGEPCPCDCEADDLDDE